EHNFVAAGTGEQSLQDGLCGGVVIGYQRADLAAGPAGADHAPRGELAVTHRRTSDVSWRIDPGAEEGRARGRENGSIVGFHKCEWNRVERDNIGGRTRWCCNDAAVADIGVGKLEA